ncbi:MAG: nucleotide sugar dehydrogenase [Bacteroidia bacterium]|nr:nucleotide sugar dehydrogenase [Bacteroidia bacterium]
MERYNPTSLEGLHGAALELKERVERKEAVIAVVGLGYVGMPIALEFAKKGFKSIGIDVVARKVDMINQGENFIEDLNDEDVKAMVSAGRLSASTSFEQVAKADVIFIAVPTPFSSQKDPDLSFIVSAGAAISEYLQPGALVILKSTTFPGTTEDYLKPQLEKGGLKAGKDFFLAFSPERVDPGNKVFTTANTPIVTGGIDPVSTIIASMVNNQIIEDIYMVSDPKVAEMEKLLENIFRSVNIALVNELALLCERMGGINVWEVVDAAGTKPFGYLKFTPGPGVGGHCIPIDPYYLSWLAREYDFETRFITLAANVNEGMPYHVVHLVLRELARQPIALADAKVLILGASFKKNVKDLRHSPTEGIIHRLIEEGITDIDISDPWAPMYETAGRTFYHVDLTEETLSSYNIVILVTDHDAFEMDFVVKHAKHIIDTRNMAKDVKEGREKITLLGASNPRKKLVFEH